MARFPGLRRAKRRISPKERKRIMSSESPKTSFHTSLDRRRIRERGSSGPDNLG